MSIKTTEKFIFEVRYKPNSSFIDQRGFFAKEIALNTIFKDWEIENNRIQFSNRTNKDILASFSYQNFAIEYSGKKGFFLGNLKETLKAIWDYIPSKDITRIGIRSISINETDSFKQAFDSINDKFVITGNFVNLFEGTLYDVALAFNFIEGKDLLNVKIGPMETKQIKSIFHGNKDLPKNGLFLDIDFFREDFPSHMKVKDVISLLDASAHKLEQQRYKLIKKILQ